MPKVIHGIRALVEETPNAGNVADIGGVEDLIGPLSPPLLAPGELEIGSEGDGDDRDKDEESADMDLQPGAEAAT
jgi:hypothetical protein